MVLSDRNKAQIGLISKREFITYSNELVLYRKKEILLTFTLVHEIKRCLLLGRKSVTNLDNILKTRDITLPTNVHLVKAMVFPVVMYGCESWTVKKAEC